VFALIQYIHYPPDPRVTHVSYGCESAGHRRRLLNEAAAAAGEIAKSVINASIHSIANATKHVTNTTSEAHAGAGSHEISEKLME
jgi:hypothetical protein